VQTSEKYRTHSFVKSRITPLHEKITLKKLHVLTEGEGFFCWSSAFRQRLLP
jgi:hypothetical protein